MNIHELDSYNLGDAVKFHRRLNPRIWGRDEHLLPEVREKLLTIAEDFQEFLGVEDLDIQDITISGSNAAYSYTKNSDIDLHLVVAMPDNPVYQELFNAKKYQYNSEHNIKIGGADVELYVQPADQPHHSQGIYSIKDSEWLQVPQRKRAQVDDACVRDKVADLDARIHAAVKSKNIDTMSTLWDKIKTMRKSGLEQHGEFGCENIAFKMLRNSGCIGLLKDAVMAAQDRELSLREAPQKKFRYGYGSEVDEASLADMRSAFARDPNLKTTKQEIFHGPDEYEKVRKQREAERQAKIAKIARTPMKPWSGGLEEGMQSQPYSTSDGVAASTKQFLENAESDDSIVQDFIQQITTELGIDPVPEIHLHTDPSWSEHNQSFGRYDPESHTLNVSMPNRHVMDVLRTVAHELVHCSQNQQHGSLPDDAGATGSRWENDANARAGIIMRDWANSHPEHFAHDALEEGASGYIPKNKKEAARPQYAMALSVDIKPGQTGREANKLALDTGRNGEPGLLMKTVNLREYRVPGEDDLDEGVRSALATAALAGTMAMGAQAKAPDMVQQIVEPGDTVYSIARQNNVNPADLLKLNKMDRNTKLEIGQRVLVPDYSKPIKKLPATVTPTVKPPVSQAAPPAASLKDKLTSMIPKFSSDSKEEQGVTLLSDNTDAEAALQTAAKAAGLTGAELAQFMAQTRHESWDFGKMKEVGNKKQFAKYDAPRKARQLGNRVKGDGERFKGRGFIQLTGRDNYTRASQQIFGDDRLVKDPDLASRLDVGAQIALWFWKNQVRPNVSNFNNTKEVTNAINPGLSGLQDRHTKFKEYMAVL